MDGAKNRTLEVRVDEDMRDKLVDLAMETDLSMSEIVRRAVAFYYRKHRESN